jgi:hypothetical protein
MLAAYAGFATIGLPASEESAEWPSKIISWSGRTIQSKRGLIARSFDGECRLICAVVRLKRARLGTEKPGNVGDSLIFGCDLRKLREEWNL